MKRALQTVLLLVAVASAGRCQKNDYYPEHWSQVYRYEIKGLPQSALVVVDSIYSRAKKDNILEEQVKALIYQSKFAVSIRENAELIIFRKFEREIQDSEPPLKNILESLLGNLYWQYFKDNRWKYYQRSQTAETVNADDFRTWDANAMFKTIHHHFSRSLENKAMLREVALESIDEILVEAENSKKCRPTLYDFLMHNALDFYSTGESMITRPSNGFKITGDAYFLDFDNVNLQSGDSLSPLRQALLLYRDLLPFHRARADTTAYVNLELERLDLIADQINFDTHEAPLRRAWSTLQQNCRNHPASTLVMFKLASLFYKMGTSYGRDKKAGNQFKLAEALTLCNEAISRFPDSDGARKCEDLKSHILNKRLSLVAEKNISINTPSFVLIRYTNVDSLHFAVYPIRESFKEYVGERIDDKVAETVMRMSSPRRQWKVKLKDIHDYQSHTTEAVLDSLPRGRYLVTATVIDGDADQDTIFAYAAIQVTNLGLLEYATMDAHHYRVVDRNNGAPIAGAEVHLQTVYDFDNTRPVDERLTTGKDGEVSMRRHPEYTRFLSATVRYQNDEATFGNYYTYAASEKADKGGTTEARTFLFTDRSIYRPGQTVFFKGILIKTKDSKSTVVPGQYVVVSLDDVNGSEVGSVRLKSNAFGAFSGAFKLPLTGLIGEYTLYADEDDEESSRFYDDLDDFTYSEHFISVEEYKRPTFEVTFKPVTETFTLNDSVRLTGVAEAYSGSRISEARVKYKVTRRVQYPRWYYWNFDRSYADAAEIAHGEIVTDDHGGFSISFKAIPDEKTPPATNPVFVYEISADIIDINGETRNATSSVKIGYHAVTATITAPEQIDLQKRDNAIGIRSENLNGQFVPLEGRVQIFKLKAPDTPVRQRPWEAPDLPLLSKQRFQKLFPHDAYAEQTDPKAWENQKLMLALAFDTRQSSQLKYQTDAT